MPLCIQKLAKPWPAAWDWAISFSWCGNRRSSPPPWMSNSVPRYLVTIAEHSRCQPGRPAPHGEAQLAVVGSPSLWPFQSAKSRGSFFPRGSASGAPCMSSIFCRVSEPYLAQERTSKYTSPESSRAG